MKNKLIKKIFNVILYKKYSEDFFYAICIKKNIRKKIPGKFLLKN